MTAQAIDIYCSFLGMVGPEGRAEALKQKRKSADRVKNRPFWNQSLTRRL